MSLDSIESRLRAYMAQVPSWTAQVTQAAESFGTPDVILDNTRRYFVIDSPASVWAQKTPDEIMADMRALLAREDEPVRFAHSGPPPILPIPHRPHELAPDEVPRVVAKARAIAVFGPKRGRWK